MNTKAPPRYLQDSTGSDAVSYDATHQRDLRGFDDAIAKIRATKLSAVLFLGPGNGHYDLLPFLRRCPDARIVAVEPSEAMRNQLEAELDKAGWRERVTLVPVDIHQALQSGLLRAAEGPRFNGIVAFSVLHHLANWRMTLHWLIQEHLDADGWLLMDEWIAGSPLYSVDCNGAHDSEAIVKYLFADRESKTGILWDPELRGHDITALVAFLQTCGFEGCSYQSELSGDKWEFDLYPAFLHGTQLAICRWGTGSRHSAYCSQLLPKRKLPIQRTVASLRFWLFTRSIADRTSRACVGYSLQPVHLSKILGHLTAELDPRFGADHAEIRQVQALQLAIHYGAYWAGTKWCIPMRAEIDPQTVLLRKGTAPIRTFLFRDDAGAAKVLTRTLVNMRRLLAKLKIQEGSITSQLLNLIQEQEDFCNMQEAVIELRLSPERQEVTHEKRGSVEFRRVTLKSPQQVQAPSTRLVNGVRQWVDNNIQYRFGDFLLVDLTKAYNALTPALDGELEKGINVNSPTSDVSESPSDQKLIELLRGFVPMMEVGEVLRLVFSPLGSRIDAERSRVEPLIFGAFLLLEQETPNGELRALDAPRLARIQVLNRLLQADVAGEQHQLSEAKRMVETARAEDYERSHMLLERLQGPLKELTESLDIAQSQVQDLRTVLYDPDEVLMFSHAAVAPYFNPDQPIADQMFPPKIRISHTPDRYTEDEAKLVFGRLFCRLLGKNQGFSDAKSMDEYLACAKTELVAAKTEPSTSNLAAFLERFCEIEDLTKFRERTKGDLSKALAVVKATLFTPFKADSRQWPKGAVLLLLEAEDFRGVERKGLLSDNRKTNLLKHRIWSPITYSTMLAFIRDIVKAWKSANATGKVSCVEWRADETSCQLSLEFSDTFRTQHEIEFLRTLLSQVLAFPREWRLDAVNHGDVNRAFVLLVNSVASASMRKA